jgi:outer membrane cobalamin receptor
VTYFDQKFHNQIDYLPSASPNYQNARASWARGIDLTVRTPLGGWGSVSAGYTYLQTRVTEGDTGSTALFRTGLPLIRRPAHSATAALTAAIPGGGSAGLTTTYSGSRQDIDFNSGGRVTLPAYASVGLSAEYPLRTLGAALSGVVLDLHVTNVLGAHYQEVLSFPALGRAIFLGGSWSVGSH